MSQMENVETSVREKRDRALLRRVGREPGAPAAVEDGGALLRQAIIEFDIEATALEFSPVNLRKGKFSAGASSALSEALETFGDSKAAKVEMMAKIDSKVSKEKDVAKKERSPAIFAALVSWPCSDPTASGTCKGLGATTWGRTS